MARTARERARELRARGPLISAGLLAGDPLDLRAALAAIEGTAAELVHLDVGDGRFCPLLGGGAEVVAAVSTPLLKDVHLMVADPLTQVERFVAAGADIVTVHPEGDRHPHRVLRVLGATAGPGGEAPMRGLALNPGTPVEVVGPLLAELEAVLLLTLDPGWRDAPDVEGTAARVAAVRALARSAGRDDDLIVAADGGIGPAAASALRSAGADVIVAGSALFAPDADAAAVVDSLLAA